MVIGKMERLAPIQTRKGAPPTHPDVVGVLRSGLVPVLFDPSLLFPDAECDVIRSFDELHGLLM